MPYLQNSLSTVDRQITQAAIFPTLEQLELLGFIEDFELTSTIFECFWEDYFANNGDAQDNPPRFTDDKSVSDDKSYYRRNSLSER